ncbi:hypothetical protein OUZ56_013705 [Daphnia magna]|uniref:Uncharacterized protein n=1 Tax=Daphnia magna TaxID=35525 RepID=A0ABQ9Z6P3_9CRUS|nr:hypothetical protein OUZ56_013705 [Daphnia magna]
MKVIWKNRNSRHYYYSPLLRMCYVELELFHVTYAFHTYILDASVFQNKIDTQTTTSVKTCVWPICCGSWGRVPLKNTKPPFKKKNYKGLYNKLLFRGLKHSTSHVLYSSLSITTREGLYRAVRLNAWAYMIVLNISSRLQQ